MSHLSLSHCNALIHARGRRLERTGARLRAEHSPGFPHLPEPAERTPGLYFSMFMMNVRLRGALDVVERR